MKGELRVSVNKKLKFISVVCVSMFLLGGCMSPQATGLEEEDINFIQLDQPTDGQETAVIKTSLGDITMILFEEHAPNTVANFKALINEGFFDNKSVFVEKEINTVVSGFTDDTTTSGRVAINDGKPIECEVTPNLWHFSGAVSVLGFEKSKLSRDMLSDSRFFIVGNVEANSEMADEMKKYNYPQKVIDAYKEYGGLPQYTGSYTVFGQVVSGLDIVDHISKLEQDSEGHLVDDVKIETITLSKYQTPLKQSE